MPAYICNECRLLFEHSYRFKQMCKKADTSLRQYPLTGKWESPLKKPTIPEELLPKKLDTDDEQQYSGSSVVPQITTSSDNKINYIPFDEVFLESGNENDTKLQTVHMTVSGVPSQSPKKPKLLNKSSFRILNKEASVPVEPRISTPKVRRDIDGNIAVVTEIIDPNLEEADAILNAEPVETNVFPCPHCERSFPLRQLRDIHMVNHNRERSFQCKVCDKWFFSKYDLQKHAMIHTEEKPHKCVVCNKAFTRATLLYRHQRVHTDIPKLICVYCEKPFLSKEEMERHTERHRKIRPYQCKTCLKSFAFKQGLERHEMIHSRVQPHPCQYCEQSFSTASKLARHLTAHAGNRPYPCKFCPKSYLLSHHLTRHLRSHKNGLGTFVCVDCDKSFNTRDNLIYHSAVHATQTLVCPLCKEAFESIESVTSHIKQHAEGESFACEFCDLIFMTPERLQVHIDREHVDEMVAYLADDRAKADQMAANDRSPNEEDEKEANSTKDIDKVIEKFFCDEVDDDPLSLNVKEEQSWSK